MPSRRRFLQTAAGFGAAPLVLSFPDAVGHLQDSPIACQQYTWYSYYLREERDWFADYNASMSAFRASGLTGYEPAFNTLADVDRLRPYLSRHGVWMSSLYVNSTLHIPDQVEASIADAVAIAEAAKSMGARIVVTNPSPIAWGTADNKDDAQLALQAASLDRLGAALRERELVLAYHNHDAELRAGAREFHHMMHGTDPANVKLCLDAHWVYRGTGNSQVALFDIAAMYADRIVELHLRQSTEGIWSETFGPGDIDYPRLAGMLHDRGVRPHLVIEQAAETGTPHTMPAVETQKRSLAYATEVFGDFIGG